MVRFFSNNLRGSSLRWAQSISRHRFGQYQSPIQLKRNISNARTLHDDVSTTPKAAPSAQEKGKNTPVRLDDKMGVFRSCFTDFPRATPPDRFAPGTKYVLHGFIGKRKDLSAKMSFVDLELTSHHIPHPIQIISNWDKEGSTQHQNHKNLKNIPAYSPVVAEGIMQQCQRKSTDPKDAPKWDLKLKRITCLNPFPKDIIVSKDAVWPPKSRHLQLRFDPLLRERLYFRSYLHTMLTDLLQKKHFTAIETPVLFKSTPEGAREFLVPTRRPGYAYALTQSPQQYKQILMAGGIHKYFQFAKCFRDEDHRADRQPEFTQLDMEMAFATGQDMIYTVRRIVESLSHAIYRNFLLKDVNGVRHPTKIKPHEITDPSKKASNSPGVSEFVFPELKDMTYENAMSNHGSDKPDLRIRLPYVSIIKRMNEDDLSKEFIGMITNLETPTVDSCNFRLGVPPKEAKKFINQFLDALPNTTIKLSPGSTPAVFIYDSSQPLSGLSALGHESAQKLEEAQKDSWGQYEDGDIILMHARKNEPFYGGSTDLGKLRTAIHAAAVNQGFIPKDPAFRFLFVHSFPLFTPNTPNSEDPGQGGSAGFSATHHPFTAPLTVEDFDLLATDPLKAKADHYDLVLNGVEIGGGSRRIHVAEVQEYVMRDILKMTNEGVAEFAHLLEALRAGCPPHAGFAFGFDRLVSVLLDMPSVKDVLAFPKSNKGEDLMVRSPSKVTPEQEKIYHITAAAKR